jgi:DNA (cytosine-5)-methyltransferase 1
VRAVDLFAGFGGLTAGAEAAGVRVVWAANHCRFAVDVHAANHPNTEHACQDLRQADWSSLPAFDMLLAAPACQGHSPGSQPRRRPYHDAMRSTAWAVVDCAEVTRPRAIVVENVLALRRWELFPLWRSALETLGYHVAEIELTATDFGVPQFRRRLFVVGTRGRNTFPGLRSRCTTVPAFGPSIDAWEADGWAEVDAAPPGARARIRAAQARSGRRCLVQHTTGHRGVPLDEPIRTITTKRQWVLVDGDAYRYLTPRELARGMGFAESFRLPDAPLDATVRGLGNAVCPPVAAALVGAVAEHVTRRVA